MYAPSLPKKIPMKIKVVTYCKLFFFIYHPKKIPPKKKHTYFFLLSISFSYVTNTSSSTHTHNIVRTKKSCRVIFIFFFFCGINIIIVIIRIRSLHIQKITEPSTHISWPRIHLKKNYQKLTMRKFATYWAYKWFLCDDWKCLYTIFACRC